MNCKALADMINHIGEIYGHWHANAAIPVHGPHTRKVICSIPAGSAAIFEHVRARVYELIREHVIEVNWTHPSPACDLLSLQLETNIAFVRYKVDQFLVRPKLCQKNTRRASI